MDEGPVGSKIRNPPSAAVRKVCSVAKRSRPKSTEAVV